jgi:hypothetical protein
MAPCREGRWRKEKSKNAHKNCGSTEIIPLQLCIKTGFTNIEYSIGAKWLEPLKEVTPHGIDRHDLRIASG